MGNDNRVVQSSLPNPIFDHIPILLDGVKPRRGVVSFLFENMWLKEDLMISLEVGG